jgi:hypothetical protein
MTPMTTLRATLTAVVAGALFAPAAAGVYCDAGNPSDEVRQDVLADGERAIARQVSRNRETMIRRGRHVALHHVLLWLGELGNGELLDWSPVSGRYRLFPGRPRHSLRLLAGPASSGDALRRPKEASAANVVGFCLLPHSVGR